MALKKMCEKCGCLINANEKYCSACKKEYEKNKHENNKMYDLKYRNKKTDKFYHSRSWIITREQIKQRDHGLCML